MGERMFPLLYGHTWQDREDLRNGAPTSVPWSLVAPHERQAEKNHGGQTLEDLARRGGLGVCEMVAVLEDRPWRRMVTGAAAEKLKAILAAAPRTDSATKGGV